MNKYNIDDESAEFLESFMDNFNMKYPPRMIAGVNKYKSVIHKNYTVEEHLENTEQELFDGLAYVHALKYLVRDLRSEIVELKARIKELEDESRNR